MLRGEAVLGDLRVVWDVPERFASAAGGLEYLSAPGSSAEATRSALWSVAVGRSGPAPARYAAFYGPVRLVLEGEVVRLWSADGELRVTSDGVHGMVDGSCTVLASIALHALAAHAALAHSHAALVALDGSVVLLPGGSGAGKTSAALAIARHGGELLSDDVVYLGADRIGWPLRRPPHAAAATLAAHPGLEVLGPVHDGVLPKTRVRAPVAGPASPRPIDAIVVPTLDPTARTRLDPIEPAAVFPILLGTSALTVVEGSPRRDEVIDVIARFAALPAARLTAGPDALADPTLIPRAIRAWLASR